MAHIFHDRRSRGAITGLLLMGTLLVIPASPPLVTASPATSASWMQVGADINGETRNDQSGRSVAMSSDGTTVIVGAPGNDANGDASGHSRVYHFDGIGWNQVGADIDGEAARDDSGFAVAMSSDGTTVAIGARFGGHNGFRSGHARVYRFDGTDWVQVGGDIDGEAAGDAFGQSVAMSGDGATVIVGAAGNDGNGNDSGQSSVYRFDGTDWAQVGGDIDGEAERDNSGFAVAMSSDGTTVIVGAISNDGNGTSSGHGRVFRFDGSDWVQVGADIDGEAEGDGSGFAVAMSGDGATVIVGARGNDENGTSSGHGRVFRFDGTDWVQVGGDIDGEAAGDLSGFAVAMSSDGTTVIVGAIFNDGNGVDSGHVRVYRFDDTDWVQVGGDIDGEAAGDLSGFAVAMSGDGTTVVITALHNDGNGVDSGHARVYRFGSQAPLACGDVTGSADELAAAGYNVIVGSNGGDFLPGTPGNDFILGLDGKDVILAGMGDDVVCAGASHDIVVGGDGGDRLHGDAGNDQIWGGNDADRITGGTGKDLLNGGNGNDDISGDGANDTIRGGHDDDVLRGGDGKDDIRGDVGNDMLFGDAHDDVLRGHGGVDVCDGGTQVDGDEAFSCETLIDVP